MTMRKAMALAGLVLALAALGPVSALANAEGTDRPMQGPISGTVSLNVLTLHFAGDATGVATHLGNYTARLTGGPTPKGLAGTATLVAANGDELTGDITLTVEAPILGPHKTTQVTEINGGTGRFANASGTLTTVYQVTPYFFDGVTQLATAEGTTTGHISY